MTSKFGKEWLEWLEGRGVFFSSPLDLDFAMLRQFSAAYEVEEQDLEDPDDETIVAVLGKSHGDADQYSEEEQRYFDAYHHRFKLSSKPAAHLEALAALDDAVLNVDMPESIDRLLDMVTAKLAELPE